ncbi:hypothetical protein AWB74_02114 [Caballeronia arvi]|uniref:Uncharacterized protein n=1 Tax=Caballeronia arvi TaxID=1777135 RepID=A0A158HT00_9BURK|nr:hypothetical protein [Caballeronia arvi]SAL47217.1 hypothetical protein AWB74_02114 [Caballeronia arvi]
MNRATITALTTSSARTVLNLSTAAADVSDAGRDQVQRDFAQKVLDQCAPFFSPKPKQFEKVDC